MKLETAAVRRRFWKEQEERNQKIQREYLRMLNKRMHLGYLTQVEAFLEADEKTLQNRSGAQWHISYFSEGDKRKIGTFLYTKLRTKAPLLQQTAFILLL